VTHRALLEDSVPITFALCDSRQFSVLVHTILVNTAICLDPISGRYNVITENVTAIAGAFCEYK